QTGIGIASFPIPQAAAPEVVAAAAITPGIPLPDGTYSATIAWTNSQGEEGASATPATITTSTSTLAVHAGTAPTGATGWNVYVGVAPDATTLQNNAPIAAGQSWLQPGVLGTAGRAPGAGQSPSYMKPVP